MERTLLFDFDSTWTRVEALDILAEQLAANGRLPQDAVAEIAAITELGMSGELGFAESLQRRMAVLNFNVTDLIGLVEYLKGHVSPSIIRNQQWVRANAHRIYIVSNGFEEFIAPVVAEMGIAGDHVIANKMIVAADGWVKGADSSIALSGDNGKPVVVHQQGFRGSVWAIGDGFTDYQIREAGMADKFIAFTENVRRDLVVQLADAEAPDLDTLIQLDLQ